MIDIRELTPAELDRVVQSLPLHRFDSFERDAIYLIAWDRAEPVGHVHVAWTETELGLPELQDMYVLPGRRSAGIGGRLARAAEELAAARGHERCSLSVSDVNVRARALYERLGYTRADVAPKQVQGTIVVRGGVIEADEMLLYFTKPVVDLAPGRSS